MFKPSIYFYKMFSLYGFFNYVKVKFLFNMDNIYCSLLKTVGNIYISIDSHAFLGVGKARTYRFDKLKTQIHRSIEIYIFFFK